MKGLKSTLFCVISAAQLTVKYAKTVDDENELKMPYKKIAATCFLWFALVSIATANAADDYEKARQLYVDGKHAKVIVVVNKLLPSEDISQTNRSNLYTFRGVAYSAMENYENAIKDFSMAITLAPKNNLGDIRYQRFFPYFNLDRMEDAYKDMLFVAQEYPDDAMYFRISTITKMADHLKKNGRHEEQFLLLSALDKSDYTGNEPLEFFDWLYVDLLREYTKRQQFFEANRLLKKFTQASVLLRIRLDRDFEALWNRPEFAQLMDVNDFPSRELKNAQLLLASYPKSWKSVADVAYALRINGRNEEAIVLAKLAMQKSGAYTFEPDHELWLQNELALALSALGRFDEANAVLEAIADINLKKKGEAVSQLLNYGASLMSQGKTEKAMAVVKKSEGFVSNRGSLVAKYVNACSMQQIGNLEAARKILVEMLANDENGVDMVFKTMACMKESEQLESYAIKKLAIEEEKLSILKMLVTCKINPLAPPMEQEIDRQFASLAARPAIKKAVQAVGTSLSFSGSCSDF